LLLTKDNSKRRFT